MFGEQEQQLLLWRASHKWCIAIGDTGMSVGESDGGAARRETGGKRQNAGRAGGERLESKAR